MEGQVASTRRTDSAIMNNEKAIAVKSNLFVFNLKYAMLAKMAIKAANVSPPTC